jgi:hypothetical protein
VLYGGQDATGQLLDDTWEWDGTTWQLRAVSGPGPQPAPAMAYDSTRNQVVLVGGAGTWEWDGTVWAQRDATANAVRSHAAIAYDSRRGVTVRFGGFGGPGLEDDTREWDGGEWRLRHETGTSTTGPSARHGHAMAYDVGRGRSCCLGVLAAPTSATRGNGMANDGCRRPPPAPRRGITWP